ncbi:MAG: carbohydrate binding domain-containing protein, partial [Chitinispirillaceae bacterium]
SITANFSEVQQTNYALNTTAEGSGTVDKDPDDEGYAQGTEVAVTATPDEGWIFNGWTGDVSSTENPLSITMDADKSICATFVEQGTQGEELIVNGSFENEDENWHLGVYDAEAEGSVVDEEYETAIDQAGSEHWNVQFTQGGITLEQGKSYCLTFRARAVANRSVVVNVGQNGGAYTSYSELQEVQLSTTMKSHSITFDMTEPTDSNARVEFNSGTNDLNWYIDDVSLKEAASTPVNRTTPLPSGWSASISKGELTLKSPVNDKGAVALYDIRGKLAAMLASGRISAGKTALNLSDIPAGNYILSVRTRSAGETFRKNISVVK